MKAVTVIYPGPGHILAVDDLRIRRGIPTEISEELFERLQRDPSMELQVVSRRREPRNPKPAAQAETSTADQADENADSGEEEVTSHG